MSKFHIVTVGWDPILIDGLCRPVASRSRHRFSHIMHPRHSANDFRSHSDPALHFFCETPQATMPDADRELLQSLEASGVPTIHNMILGDRVVSALKYQDALGYATFLARRFMQIIRDINPSVIIGGFDAIHAGIALAVAKHAGIPWFALNFSVIPTGLACFCDQMTPAARVQVGPPPDADNLRALAAASLASFESGRIQAPAYVESHAATLAASIGRIPRRLQALTRTIRNSNRRESLRFTETPGRLKVSAAVRRVQLAAAARRAVLTANALTTPPTGRFVLFGLHMQPESSIDVWAPYFSNQMWVIELLARSIPPSHNLLVKIHRSDLTNFTSDQLKRIQALPGVDLVRPFADSRGFIDRADLVISIQGTMGLEAVLLGKPVIMLGDSPVTIFRSASRIEALQDLPKLIKEKLSEAGPTRQQIIEDYASYLKPFSPASHNDWSKRIGEQEIDDYVRLFDRLEQHLTSDVSHLDT